MVSLCCREQREGERKFSKQGGNIASSSLRKRFVLTYTQNKKTSSKYIALYGILLLSNLISIRKIAMEIIAYNGCLLIVLSFGKGLQLRGYEGV